MNHPHPLVIPMPNSATVQAFRIPVDIEQHALAGDRVHEVGREEASGVDGKLALGAK